MSGLVVLAAVVEETVVDATAEFFHTFLRIEILLFCRCADKAEFGKHSGHGSVAEHKKSGLVYAFVLSAGTGILQLYASCQLHTLLHEAVLHQFEDYIAFGFVGIEAFVSTLVIVLEHDDGVFAFGHFKIGAGAGHTERIGFRTVSDASVGKGIGMDRNEKVGLIIIGNVGTLLQRNEHIGLARVNNLHVGAVAFYEMPKG